MGRLTEFQGGSANPAAKFTEWKSEDKCLSYYDKEKGENVSIKLPFSFLTLMPRSTVKGWHDASESRIYANEVKMLSSEPLTVKSFKGGTIEKGLYNDIKEQVSAAGGHFALSLYVMTPKGTLVNISLKGSAAGAWMDFIKNDKKRVPLEWITVKDAEERKKGKVTYSVPVFEFKRLANAEESASADVAYDEIDEHLNGISKRKEEAREEDNEPKGAVDKYHDAPAEKTMAAPVNDQVLDDLPF